jgi:hypothetical protein
VQAKFGDACHQTGVLQGRLDAVQAANATLQQELVSRRQADAPEAQPVRAESARLDPRATNGGAGAQVGVSI